MISETTSLFEKITSVVDSGIGDDYDAFVYECLVGDSYLEFTLSAELGGREIMPLNENIDTLAMERLVKELKSTEEWVSAGWSSFVVTYRSRGEVKVVFGRERAAWDTRA